MHVKITPELIAEHGLTASEYETILDILGREPSITELGIFSVMWSEHCSYKNSKPLLRTLPTEGPNVLQGPGENAGIVDFDDTLALCFKIESHNHPSAVEPVEGAATGVGGILRDIFTMGARPIALLDSLRFGDPTSARTQHIARGVVRGISDYGNSVGVPTVGGETYFARAYEGNPLVNVMCVGVIAKDNITRAVASGVGNLVVYYGNATGRDGIHGATFASAELDDESTDKRGAIQVGDPFMEKKILEATLQLIESQSVVALQDMGAAGLTCSTAEMAGRGGMGINVDLDKVPQRARNMSAYEIMLSESQERMLAIVEPHRLDEVSAILNRWDLEAHVIGTLDDSGLMKVTRNGELVASLPADKVSDNSPVYHRESRRPAYLDALLDARRWTAPHDLQLSDELCAFLASPNIATKRWIWQQYDYMVQTQTHTGPGDNAAVLRVHGSKNSAAIATDGHGLYCYLDPYEGGKLAVAEACRNVACTGAEPLAITNCLNFGSPLKPEIFYQLSEAVRGMSDACRALDAPVTGGNVSLFNESPDGAVFPTPVIGAVGRISAETKPLKGGFPRPGLDVVLLGHAGEDLGGSEYLHWKTGQAYGPCPKCDLKYERALQELVRRAAGEGMLHSAHDCSLGGLFVTLAEALLWGGDGVGAHIEVPDAGASPSSALVALLNEAASRIVVTVAPENSKRLVDMAFDSKVMGRIIGTTTHGGVLELRSGGLAIADLAVAALQKAYESPQFA